MTQANDVASLLSRAWESSIASPAQSQAEALAALDAAQPGSQDAAWAFWLQALADLHGGNPGAARARLQPARLLFIQHDCARGQALCAELDAAIALRSGDPIRASLIHRALDGVDPGYKPFDRFFGQMQRALFARLLGQWDKALRHLLLARDAAEAGRNAGALAMAQTQLGGLQLEFGRLPEAQARCEAGLSLARRCNARSLITSAAAQLIVILHARGQTEASAEMAQFLLDNPESRESGGLARVAVPLALAAFGADDVDRAEAWLENGSAASAMDGDNALFWAWLSARCLMHRGEYRMARDLVERTLAARPPNAPPFHLAQVMHAASEASAALGLQEQAQAHRDAALRLEAGPEAAAGPADVTSTAGYRSDARHSVPAL